MKTLTSIVPNINTLDKMKKLFALRENDGMTDGWTHSISDLFCQIADINISYFGQDQTIRFDLDSADYILAQKSFAVGHCNHFRYQ